MNNQQLAKEIAQLLAGNGIIPMPDDQIEMSIVPTHIRRGESLPQCTRVKWAEINLAAARLCLQHWKRAVSIDLDDVRLKGIDQAMLDVVREEMQQYLSADIDQELRELYRERSAA